MRYYCDRCRARANWGLGLIAGNLHLCNHHYQKHKDALADQAVLITRLQEETTSRGREG